MVTIYKWLQVADPMHAASTESCLFSAGGVFFFFAMALD